MILIDNNFNLFDYSEYSFFKDKCDDFKQSERVIFYTEHGENYYNRLSIDMFSEISKKIFKKIDKYVKNTLKSKKMYEFEIDIANAWINKITSETNKTDDYHVDNRNVTFILYLNDNFEGGEFQYIDDKGFEKILKPKKNLAIISNKKLKHRVLPVKSGERYSLVCFFNKKEKNNKTLY